MFDLTNEEIRQICLEHDGYTEQIGYVTDYCSGIRTYFIKNGKLYHRDIVTMNDTGEEVDKTSEASYDRSIMFIFERSKLFNAGAFFWS